MSSSELLTVVVNDRALRTPRTGVGHYVHELLRHWPTEGGAPSYVPFYFTHVRSRARLERVIRPRGDRPIQGSRKPWAVRRALQAGYGVYFRAVCRVKRYGLYHEPNHIPMRFAGPTITTIHDLSVLRFPQWHPADRVRWYEHGLEGALRRSAHFVAVSEFTRQEVIGLLGVDPQRITVIHNAARDVFTPASAEEYEPLLRRLGIRRPFLLFVGTVEPRKNLDTLLSAFARVPISERRDMQLVVAGGIGWGEALDWRGERARACNLVPAGYVADEELRLLYSACEALVWPSRYEGFGLPPLECMACGRPVITANTSSLPEVVGDAALTVDPENVEDLCEAIRRLIGDAARVERLVRMGRERAGQFSWDESARKHAALFARVARDWGAVR